MTTASMDSFSTRIRSSVLSQASSVDPYYPMIRSLFYRAKDAAESESIFKDQTAKELVDELYDQLTVLECVPRGMRYLMTTRCMIFDLYCTKFMDYHSQTNKECAVLNLSGGLDTRMYRLMPKKHVQWYEVDKPAWIDLRKELLTTNKTGDNIHMVPHDLFRRSWLDEDLSWLEQIPKDTPTLIIMESIAVAFQKPQFDKVIRKILNHLSVGEVVLDVNGRAAQVLVSNKLFSWSRKIRAQVEWSCEDPSSLESLHPGLKYADQKSCVTVAEEDFDDWASVLGKMRFKMMKGRIFGGTIRNQSRVLRYTYNAAPKEHQEKT